MIKSDLIHQLAAQNPHLYEHDVTNIVNVILTEIIHALRNGHRVELRGFGAFTTKSRGARKGRNPRNGTSVDVVAKRMPSFKCGKDLRERLNRTES